MNVVHLTRAFRLSTGDEGRADILSFLGNECHTRSHLRCRLTSAQGRHFCYSSRSYFWRFRHEDQMLYRTGSLFSPVLHFGGPCPMFYARTSDSHKCVHLAAVVAVLDTRCARAKHARDRLRVSALLRIPFPEVVSGIAAPRRACIRVLHDVTYTSVPYTWHGRTRHRILS